MPQAPLRIVFAGTPDFAASALQRLLTEKFAVVAVYTQPDRPAGRGRKLKPSPVKQLALDADIPLQQPKSLKDATQQTLLAEYHADVMIVAAYGLLLPEIILQTPRLGCLNIHASLLPRWRGAAPIQRAILAGDTQSGVTIMQMDKGLDTGAMLLRKPCDITANETGGSLHDKLAALGADAIIEILQALQQSQLDATPQDESLACYAKKLDKQEAWIDWRQPAQDIERKIRAFNPWPVAQTRLADKTLRIWSASLIEQVSDAAPGTITAVTNDAICVSCGTQQLQIHSVQLAGGKTLSISALRNGHPHLLQAQQQFTGME